MTQAVDKSARLDREGKQPMVNEQFSRRTMNRQNAG
jgi:hypothetical protein